ncbi:MAG: GNAT family protein [Polyangiaceae bacterium]
MLRIPPKEELRDKPLLAPHSTLMPLLAADGPELWEVVDASRSWLDPWLPWVPFQKNVDASRRFAEASAREWDVGRALRFVMRERPGGDMIGIVGLENCQPLHRSCELGYWLREQATGRGLMTEAARTCLAFAFDTVGAHRVRVAAATENHPSLRVIERLGFRYEGRARQAEWVGGRWVDHAVFALLETDWRSHEAP